MGLKLKSKYGTTAPFSGGNLTVCDGDFNTLSDMGCRFKILVARTEVAMTGGLITVTATGLRLAKKFIVGITGRVIVPCAGAALGTANIGDGTDADRYGAALDLRIAGTTFDFSTSTATPYEWLASAGNIVFTGSAGVFSSGTVAVHVHYIELGAPTR
jgi:hypothetical protein